MNFYLILLSIVKFGIFEFKSRESIFMQDEFKFHEYFFINLFMKIYFLVPLFWDMLIYTFDKLVLKFFLDE